MRHFRLSAFLLTLVLLTAAPALAQKSDKPKKLVAPKEDPNLIYDYAEEPADPVGGIAAFNQHIVDHLSYPITALEARKQGTDSVEFVVEKNGTLTNVKLRGAGFDPACDAEALRVVRTAPKWRAAKRDGRPVRMRVVMPITFALPANAAPATATDAPASAAPVPTPSGGPVPVPGPAGPKLVQPETGATYPGGTDAFFAWVQQHLQYPARARSQKLQGKVRVEFMIEPDGSLSDIKLLNHLGGGLDEEALRLIKASPKWTPAVYQGQPMRSKMALPILFQL